MPSTINGIGTWYYGQRNRFQRRGTCEHCGATSDLKSYDTTLYFVFFFVPLVPLSSKRVLDECGQCQKHRVLKLKDWNRMKDEAVATTNAAVEASPNSPAPLIDAIGTATGFQHLPQFEAFCEYASEQFPNDPDVLAAVAGGRMYFSQWDKAADSLEKQLAIRPADAVRRQAALSYLKQLRPDDAQPHLQHIIDGKLADQSGFLWLLAEGHAAVGNHGAAVDTLKSLAEVDPAVLADKDYKKKLAASEKLAGKGSSKSIASTLLGSPKGASYSEGSRFQLSRWIGPLVALGLAILYFWSAIATGEARKVWVVSGLPVPYTAKINGQDVLLQPFTYVRRTVPEGDIPVAVADPKLGIPAGTAAIKTNFFLRPFLSRTFVINPDQSALVSWEKAYYAKNPADAPDNERQITGDLLVHQFSSVDHEFEQFPREVKTKGSTTSRTRVSVVAPPEFPLQMLALFASATLPPESASNVLWRWANAQPDNELLLAMATRNVDARIAAERFQPRLAERPVLVDWHRAYQTLRDQDPALVAEYEAMLQKEPENPDLSYLVGRLVEDPVRERELFEKASQGNPPSAHAWNALALSSLGRGEFEQAYEQVNRARELLPGRRAFSLAFEDACKALGKWHELAHAYENDQAAYLRMNPAVRSPTELQLQIWLGNPEGAETLRRQFLQAAQSSGMSGPPYAEREASLEHALREARGEWDAIAKTASEPNATPTFEVLLLVKKWNAAAESIEERKDEGDAAPHILLSLLAREAGEAALADAQLAIGIKALQASNRNSKPFAEALQPDAKTADVVRLTAAALPTADKCVLLVAVAKKFPDQAGELLPLARKLNFHRDLQAHLMEAFISPQ